MRSLFRLLLKLTPHHFQRDFSDEVMAILSQRLEQEGRSFAFVFREVFGLIPLIVTARTLPPQIAPLVGGITIAATLHYTLYTVLGLLLRKLSTMVTSLNAFSSNPDAQPLMLVIWVVFCFLGLIPLFLMMAFRVRLQKH